MTHLHEGRRLNQAQYHDSGAGSVIHPLGSQTQSFTGGSDGRHSLAGRTTALDWKTESALDSAKNKLQ